MLQALCNETQKNIISWQIGGRKEIEGKTFGCPNCGNKMMFVDAIEKIKHFRHYSENLGCYSEPETEEHMLMKKICFEKLSAIYGKNVANEEYIELEKKIENSRADVFIKPNIAIECQASSISVNDLRTRTERYSKNGIYVCWILSAQNFLDDGVDCRDGWECRRKITATEQEVHDWYRSRIYYFWDGDSEDEENIMVIHYKQKWKPIGGWSLSHFFTESNKDVEWERRNKTVREVYTKEIDFGRMITYEQDGLKLAKFEEKKFW